MLALWDLRLGQQIALLSEEAAGAAVSITPDGTRALALFGDRCVVYSPEEQNELGHLALIGKPPIAMAPDSSACVIAGNGELHWLRLKPTLELTATVKSAVDAAVTTLAFNATATLVASADDDGTLQVWDARPAAIAPFSTDAALTTCTFVGANTICAGNSVGRLHLLHLEGWRCLRPTRRILA